MPTSLPSRVPSLVGLRNNIHTESESGALWKNRGIKIGIGAQMVGFLVGIRENVVYLEQFSAIR